MKKGNDWEYNFTTLVQSSYTGFFTHTHNQREKKLQGEESDNSLSSFLAAEKTKKRLLNHYLNN